MYAIIKTGGKQYRVKQGQDIVIEKLDAEKDSEVIFDQVLSVVNGEETTFGRPLVEGAVVRAKVLEHGKGKKIRIFKFKSKSNYRRRQGHRQPYTKVRVEAIQA